ncbi:MULTISPECIES: mechanosensitive ion channel family protein [Flavobacterium]|uniref:Small conductance mechanosensitive channel n=1 Tax=Flavobacterium lindanitolerans TaxID=428988 RepID=A0A497UZY1_9FLAO|nr:MULTISPECIES: mechanosensitive ion channel domain-containing protein [Flavobacterium]OJX48843.1 MAG: mechanosensitive ion channel protein MscS [Flavobacterium sp. 38-13]PKW21129.1 small conductance mechanosensitive channel [Flavobacterium lindanitolerans]RLJ30233.1 small conductance mechanosensitive channel [Flavobacterium lindanitolerans]
METLNQYFQKAVHTTTAFLPHLLSAIITLVVGFIIIRLFRKFMMRLIEKKRFDATLLKFVMDVAVWTMRALLFVSIITKLGVETSAFVAAIGAAGLAIGLSLQGSLSNFAGGLLIILFKPLRVGDYVEAQGEAGTVAAIFIFSTKIITGNNQSIYLPNGALSNGIIRNFSKEKLRRAEITLSVNHDSDISLVKALLFNVIRSDKRILQLPEPAVMIKDITADALLLSVLMWTTNEDYGWVVSDFLENIKKSFKEQGISNPAPKREIIIEIKNYRDTKEK